MKSLIALCLASAIIAGCAGFAIGYKLAHSEYKCVTVMSKTACTKG